MRGEFGRFDYLGGMLSVGASMKEKMIEIGIQDWAWKNGLEIADINNGNHADSIIIPGKHKRRS